jgi:hypothetical protein
VSVYVFLGPTLAAEEARAVCDVVCLPPVAQGDVYRVAQRRPRAIGIIDGYFAGVPAVWHKEILWAMAQGVHVFGAASMGALRAAELHRFGMVGIGAIFEAYRDAVLTDDDEVALVHGPAEFGYRARTEAMVNIRSTLERAKTAGVITDLTRDRLLAIAKNLFYQKRLYETVLQQAHEQGLAAAQLAALRAWLPGGRVDQKRADALKMLEAIRRWLTTDPAPKRIDYHLERTEVWEQAAALAETVPCSSAQGQAPLSRAAVLEELRLAGASYHEIKRAALLRILGLREFRRRGLRLGQAARRTAMEQMRQTLGLLYRREIDAWVAANDVDLAAFEQLADDAARLDRVAALAAPLLDRAMLDQLRSDGAYAQLAARARAKRDKLAARGRLDRELADVGVTAFELEAWYFERRLGRAIPDDVAAYAAALDFADVAAFHRMLLHEYLYLHGA